MNAAEIEKQRASAIEVFNTNTECKVWAGKVVALCDELNKRSELLVASKNAVMALYDILHVRNAMKMDYLEGVLSCLKAAIKAAEEGTEMRDNALEPYGGNIYRKHNLMVHPGQFWRCAHGLTGFGAEMEWLGCKECEQSDPVSFSLFHSKSIA